MDPFPQHGNPATHNIETVLERNIVASMYYKNKCLPLTTVPDLVDEIYYSVTDVEPWLSGAARGTPSTAFCLLHRFCSLRPTLREVRSLLDHADSPYIRAIGFLFLRYVGDPRTVWGLVDPYLADPEEFCPSPTQTAPGERAPGGDQNTQTVTLGAFVRDLFLSHVYYETLAPRIPKPRRRSRSRSPPRRRDFDDRDYSRRHGELYTRARGWTPPREHHHRR